MESSDSAVAGQARQGDQNAFRVLVERHSRSVFRLAFRMTGREEDAEDVVQETFLRAYKQIHRFDGRAAFSTWLYRICANCALDSIRARKSRKEQQPAVVDENGTATHWLEHLAAPNPSPERLTQSGQIAQLIEPALQKLTETERIAFVLRHYEGCDIQEIARTLGVETNAAKHSVFRAVQKLRRALQPVYDARSWGMAR